MLHFVKQFKRKKTTFENFFVQKTNAEYTVTDNAQEAFPEKPCGSAVKAVVPCLLKKILHFSKPPPTENGSWNTGNGQCTRGFSRKTLRAYRQNRCSLPLEKNFALFKTHTYGKRQLENGQRTKAFLRNALFVICDTSHFQHGAKHSYILKDLTVKIVPQTEIDGMFSKFAKPLIKNKITVLF